MRQIFIDWGTTKPSWFVDEHMTASEKATFASQFLDCEIFMEYGAPYHAIVLKLLENNQVFLCKGEDVKEVRKDREKADHLDPLYIRELYGIDPSKFREVTKEVQRQLEYDANVKLMAHAIRQGASFKNKQKAFIRQFGERNENFDLIINAFEERKEQLLKKVSFWIKQYTDKLRDNGVKGISESTVAQLLSFAHPNKFPVMGAYLAYCGYKNSTRGTGTTAKERKESGASFKYNRDVKGVMYNAVDNLIRKNGGTPEFREIYDKCRQDFIAQGFVSKNKDESTKMKDGKIVAGPAHGKAKNRVATFFLKRFWELFHNMDDWLKYAWEVMYPSES